jgi:mannose-6-phosphate isomerase-like protein (cupin superfamily)
MQTARVYPRRLGMYSTRVPDRLGSRSLIPRNRLAVRAAGGQQTFGIVPLNQAERVARRPNFGAPLHVHDDATEAVYVLDGEYVVSLDGEEYRCPAGSFVFIPAGVPHGFRVGETASRKLNFFSQTFAVPWLIPQASAASAEVTSRSMRSLSTACPFGCCASSSWAMPRREETWRERRGRMVTYRPQG